MFSNNTPPLHYTNQAAAVKQWACVGPVVIATDKRHEIADPVAFIFLSVNLFTSAQRSGACAAL